MGFSHVVRLAATTATSGVSPTYKLTLIVRHTDRRKMKLSLICVLLGCVVVATATPAVSRHRRGLFDDFKTFVTKSIGHVKETLTDIHKRINVQSERAPEDVQMTVKALNVDEKLNDAGNKLKELRSKVQDELTKKVDTVKALNVDEKLTDAKNKLKEVQDELAKKVDTAKQNLKRIKQNIKGITDRVSRKSGTARYYG